MQYLEPIVTPDDPNVDIVFVHGLNPKGSLSHARETWTDEGGLFWPEALLSSELPSARILLFAYNSSILSNASSAHVASHARTLCDRLQNFRLDTRATHRPLIFVAHSLGGLLVKQALVEARTDPLYKCLKASTHGLVFFATPHRGGEGAGVAKVAANVCSAFTGQPRNKLLESLKSKDLITQLSSDQFRHQLNDYEVLSFIERRKMPVKMVPFMPAKQMVMKLPELQKSHVDSSNFIVDETSAKLGSAGENHQDVDRNHSDICKFSGLKDHAYEGVGPNLKGMAERARQRQVQCRHSQGESWRNDLLKDIKHEWQNSAQRRISLSGLGGVGKTELSISVVEELGPIRYVLWLRASSSQDLQQDLITAAEDLRTELLRFDMGNNIPSGEGRSAEAFYFPPETVSNLVSILKRWLRANLDEESRVLIVLDDLDGLEPELHKKYSKIFSGAAVDLIYTTRDPSMADSGMHWKAVPFDVPPLRVDEAVDMLEHLSKDARGAQENQPNSGPDYENMRRERMRDVATRLGALPAAIITGSHFIADNLGSKQNIDSYQRFLDLWDEAHGKNKILASHRAMLKYRHSMLGSFEVSLQRLRRGEANVVNRDPVKQSCIALLRLLCAMDLSEISRDDLSNIKDALRLDLPCLQELVNLMPEFSDLVAEPLGLEYDVMINQCVTELLQVSLLTKRSPDGTLLLNSVIKACALLVPASISAEDRLAYQAIAKEVSKHLNKEGVESRHDDASSFMSSSNGGVTAGGKGKQVARLPAQFHSNTSSSSA